MSIIIILPRQQVQTERATTVERLHKALAGHQSNLAAKAQLNDVVGVRFAKCGIERCQSALRLLLSNGALARAAGFLLLAVVVTGCCSWEPAQSRRYRELRAEYQRTNSPSVSVK